MISKKKRLLVLGGVVVLLGLLFSRSGFADDPDKGKSVYVASCLHCHGENGDGNGPEAMQYDPRPTNFTSSHMYSLSDTMIERVVVVGIPTVTMHSWGSRLNNAEVAAVVQYIRSFRP